jgi:hypothetical protein
MVKLIDFLPSNFAELEGRAFDIVSDIASNRFLAASAFQREEEASLLSEVGGELLGEFVAASEVALLPELGIPLLLGAAAYTLYEWLTPAKEDLPIGVPPRNPTFPKDASPTPGGVPRVDPKAPELPVVLEHPGVPIGGVEWVNPVRPERLIPRRRRRLGRRPQG